MFTWVWQQGKGKSCVVFLQLAVGCRQMLKDKKYAFPPVKTELAADFFTILITFAMEAAESETYNPDGNSPGSKTTRPSPSPTPLNALEAGLGFFRGKGWQAELKGGGAGQERKFCCQAGGGGGGEHTAC